MPRFEKHIFVCENERPADHPKGSCIHNGSGNLKARFKEALAVRGLLPVVRANSSCCLDACAFGPTVVVYPDGVWYGGVHESDVEEIIDAHIIGGEPVARLLIKDPKYGQE